MYCFDRDSQTTTNIQQVIVSIFFKDFPQKNLHEARHYHNGYPSGNANAFSLS